MSRFLFFDVTASVKAAVDFIGAGNMRRSSHIFLVSTTVEVNHP
jgi:hypothetical protein